MNKIELKEYFRVGRINEASIQFNMVGGKKPYRFNCGLKTVASIAAIDRGILSSMDNKKIEDLRAGVALIERRWTTKFLQLSWLSQVFWRFLGKEKQMHARCREVDAYLASFIRPEPPPQIIESGAQDPEESPSPKVDIVSPSMQKLDDPVDDRASESDESKSIDSTQSDNSLLRLPDEVILKILSHTDSARDIARFAQVSRAGKDLADPAFIDRAKMLGYSGESDVIQCKNYLHSLWQELDVLNTDQNKSTFGPYAVYHTVNDVTTLDRDATLHHLCSLPEDKVFEVFNVLLKDPVFAGIDRLGKGITDQMMPLHPVLLPFPHLRQMMLHAHVRYIQEVVSDEEQDIKNLRLAVSAFYGDIDTMRSLLCSKAHVNALVGGLLPLHYAVHGQKLPAMQLLLDAGAYVDERELQLTENVTAIGEVCGAWRGQSFVDFSNDKGDNEEFAYQAVELLLEYGADPNLVVPQKHPSPLQFAVEEIRSVGVARLLIRAGAHVGYRIVPGASVPLTLACGILTPSPCNSKMIELLLEAGADPNVEIAAVRSFPLASAVWCRDFEAVSLLLKFGADVNKNYGGNTALHGACMRGKSDIVPDPKIIRLLLQHGADPTIPNEEGQTAQALAAQIGIDLQALQQED